MHQIKKLEREHLSNLPKKIVPPVLYHSRPLEDASLATVTICTSIPHLSASGTVPDIIRCNHGTERVDEISLTSEVVSGHVKSVKSTGKTLLTAGIFALRVQHVYIGPFLDHGLKNGTPKALKRLSLFCLSCLSL